MSRCGQSSIFLFPWRCWCLSVCFILFVPHQAVAQFDLLFNKYVIGGNVTSVSYWADCPAGGGGGFTCFQMGGMPVDGTDTRFISGNVTIDGVNYAHMIIGELSSGFAQEVLVVASQQGPQCSFNTSCITDGRPTQNPTYVALRQVISETNGADSFYDEFLKDKLENKARTSQAITDGILSYNFEIDARNESLTAVPTAAVPITNTVSLNDPEIPEYAAGGPGPGRDFDMAVDSQTSTAHGSSYYYDTADNLFRYVSF